MENKGFFMAMLISWILFIALLIFLFSCDYNRENISNISTETTIELTEPSITIPDEIIEPTIETIVPTESTEPTESIEPTLQNKPVFSMEEFEKNWKESAIYMSKTIYGEARGCSREEQEKVAWCILNRVDHQDFPDTVKGVVTSGSFHGYSKHFPSKDFYDLSLEVILMWQLEKQGETVNRTLASNMLYFSAKSDGTGHNFREQF